MRTLCIALVALGLNFASAIAGPVFIEAERFKFAAGWQVVADSNTRTESGAARLCSSDASSGTATATASVKDAGNYRVWVRYKSHPKQRAPFRVAAIAGDREVASDLFDAQAVGQSAGDIWKSFEATLPEGDITLRLSRERDKETRGSVCSIDCFFLTTDLDLVPNGLSFGAKTFVRVTIGNGYDRPVYIHVFADHYRAPWYQHYSLGREGAVAGIAPASGQLLKSGDREWFDLTPMIYPDSGAMLHISARHSYTKIADRLRATFEFATEPSDKAIVRTIHAEFEPAGFAIYMPPNLLSKENIALLKTDYEIANETGRRADAHPWPTHGKKPERFPFFVSAQLNPFGLPRSASVLARERKTLDYFGFTPGEHRHIDGLWYMQGNSYCRPDVERMKRRAAEAAEEFKRAGGDVNDIVFAELTDEPTGQPLETISKDSAYLERFRTWLKGMGKNPSDLLVPDWESVRIVTYEQREQFPALYYFSQRFRTRALGDFIAVQREILEQAYGRPLPTLVNFSDGAVYAGNFYMQGVDYFELLDAPDQNAIWGEDWANLSSTYQCASYNVDLMRAAARERGQIIGHHLIAHARRTPWDIRLKAMSELARGVKILNNFAYGPSWASHEGGPYWRTHLWYAKPETWTANASLTREIGAVEDMLLTAMPAPAKVALLYSSSSDAWTINGNQAYGFDRMHTWLALSHAQVPVDIVSEDQVAKGLLDKYDVCYLTGPNLSRAAVGRLRQWVQQGGTLWLTAGAASRDEFNRPLDTLESLLPATRGDCVELQKHVAPGKYLRLLSAKDEARWEAGCANVLSMKQSLKPRSGAVVLARFKDQSAAVVSGTAGEGHIYCAGFLPALDYIKRALDARAALEERAKTGDLSAEDAALIERSANPWEYPLSIREFLLTPVRQAGTPRPIECSVPLVDAVFMQHEKGVLVPLANYTNRPIANFSMKVTVPRSVVRAESAVRGQIVFRQVGSRTVELSLPLESSDFVKLYFE